MLFKIFSLHPDIFESFTKNALIARGIAKKVIEFEMINWRDKNGIGKYKQVDDSPFGGGSGMVLMAEPIVKSMEENGCFEQLNNTHFEDVKPNTSGFLTDCHSERSEESREIQDNSSNQNNSRTNLKEFNFQQEAHLVSFAATPQEGNLSHSSSISVNEKDVLKSTEHHSYSPSNAQFYQDIKSRKRQTKKVNIMMTPRGFPMNQKVVEWLADDFDEINILCGRYEGFDARVNDYVDLELSIGNFVLNGGEVGAMCLIEAVSRLVPDFITKNSSVLHDSFSSGLNEYDEFQFDNSKEHYQNQLKKSIAVAVTPEYLISEKLAQKTPLPRGGSLADGVVLASTSERILKQVQDDGSFSNFQNLFDNSWWKINILPYIEHPQYTRPEIWRNISVPTILKSGNHIKIQKWRKKWY